MQQRLEHPRTAAAIGVAAATQSPTTGVARRPSAGAVEDVRMFGDVDPEVRLRMELLARASAGPETALPHVIALLVEGDEARGAIIEAIDGNDDLRAQWHATWEALRR